MIGKIEDLGVYDCCRCEVSELLVRLSELLVGLSELLVRLRMWK